MSIYKLAFIGFGTVGQGLAEILREKKQKLQREHGFGCEIVAICDQMKGSIYDPNGLDIEQVLSLIDAGQPLTNYQAQNGASLQTGLDAIATIEQTNANVIAEMTYTDMETGGPALEHCQKAFAAGKHVITTNKGPVVVAYHQLKQLADDNNCFWGIEGTVISGTPVIKFLQEQCQGLEIRAISGIFNGTTNYMLQQMTEGMSYEQALQQAQQLGYAEANPKADVEGLDVLAKVVILANVILGAQIKPQDLPCQGISQLDSKAVQQAHQEGKTWKLLGHLRATDQGVEAEVKPTQISQSHPLANINGALNAICIDTDLLGEITVTGPGAGKLETGYALLSDLLGLHRQQQEK